MVGRLSGHTQQARRKPRAARFTVDWCAVVGCQVMVCCGRLSGHAVVGCQVMVCCGRLSGDGVLW